MIHRMWTAVKVFWNVVFHFRELVEEEREELELEEKEGE